ncbi:BMP family ABC transporter substrate-binding protein [uncultured Meiothermus sp.]|mgnify:CR=1 FL=1|uniref:BMP family lipoprotein n=1 Tax=uncultured Meiothermus sp. TaxID=157471 RepID=UPI0026097973|nr:BMP family ABC transporter substrate-binding protein [uncultured Meiothermus sp.]
MKKFVVLGVALAAMLGLGLAQEVRVGMAFDSGGKFDRSFNQSAFEGAQRAERELRIRLFDFEPADPGQVGLGIRRFAEEGFDLIVGVGFRNEPSITRTAREFRDVKFAVIDAVPGEGRLENAVGLVFREHEGSYLVGYIAGRTTNTGVVGFVGGMDIPLIHKFEQGFRAGAIAGMRERNIASPRVLINYVGTTPAAWNDPGRAKEIATAQAKQGADIIYAAAGASGLGVLDYVKEQRCLRQDQLPTGVRFISNNASGVPRYDAYTRACPAATTRPMFMIGVDANQNYLGDTDNNPRTLNHVLTSMLKRVDVATFDVIKAVRDNTFRGGVREFGLSNDGVGFALDDFNRALIPQAVINRLAVLRSQIISGALRVPDKR